MLTLSTHAIPVLKQWSESTTVPAPCQEIHQFPKSLAYLTIQVLLVYRAFIHAGLDIGLHNLSL
jgi:hypothetical protein